MNARKIFNATSDCEYFDVALKRNQEIWIENQYPTEWSCSIFNETSEKIVTKENVTAKPTNNYQHFIEVKILTKISLNRGFVSIQRNITQNFASRLKELFDTQVIFTTRKLRTQLPTLKTSFDKNMKPHLLYKVTFAKPADMLLLEYQSTKKKISLLDNTSLNDVIQRIILNGRF